MSKLRIISRQSSRFFIAVTLFVMATGSLAPAFAKAAAAAYIPPAKVTFTFDDGLASTYSQALPTLANHGLVGTDYVISGCVGMTKAPNKCHANTDTTYMTWAQIQALQNTYGWEIGSHTVDHQCLASTKKQDPDDCPKKALTTAQVDAELANSKAALAANGINATDFAPPYGDVNNAVLKEIAKYYASSRNFRNDTGNVNVYPYSDYYLQDIGVQETVNTPAQLESRIDAAIANHQWLILAFHEISPVPSQNVDDYEYGTAELDQVAAYVQAKQQTAPLQSVTMSQGLAASAANLLPNSTFNDGIANGWTTDDAAAVKADAANNGSYPDYAKSVKLASSTTAGKNVHLFSPLVAVTPGTTYALKNYLNVQSLATGSVGFYIDEYDANGNWISGQYKATEPSSFVENMNFTYTPSSVGVSKARLQVIVAGSGIVAYIDNAQWFPVATAPVTTPTNLIANGAFNDGIADGWTTDDAADITADSSNNGSPANPAYSVMLRSGTSSNGHLFSPIVSVTPASSYSLSAWLNILQLNTASGGEVGFYIDEYDANGNWISGQYKAGDHTLGSNTVGFSYTPSSASVSKASLQVIIVSNATIQAYIDDVAWTEN